MQGQKYNLFEEDQQFELLMKTEESKINLLIKFKMRIYLIILQILEFTIKLFTFNYKTKGNFH